ncbi:Dynein heavy chain 9, axonemal [Liparis tanakae]|uniref:Dynein heavy chain 9, axonemal n=1 Tax=Liparis tanakae TaxID=230148 RepID=A0A4Z2IUB1_9TELE|nr:Dynein heavy chain 9, axonemal [Liparis tanakae]
MIKNVPFNYYTTSEMLQAVLEKPLEKKAGRNYGPPGSRRLIYFIDDMNMPEVDTYGTRHFSVFALSFPGAEALSTIYTSILSQHLRGEGFSAALEKSCPTLVQLALALHQRISSTFLPTAVKFHYIFNLRDLSNIFQVKIKDCYMQVDDLDKQLNLKKYKQLQTTIPQHQERYKGYT